MPGIVSIVGGAAGDYARGCWDLLGREFGLPPGPPGAIPHVSYHVSEQTYRGGSLLDEAGEAVAARTPFDVASPGLGVFAGPPPVIYLTITRTGDLSQLQQSLWEMGERHAPFPYIYGGTDRWVPHLTLAMDGLTPELMPQAVALLLPRIRAIPVHIDNVALLNETSGEHQVVRRWDFATETVAGQ